MLRFVAGALALMAAPAMAAATIDGVAVDFAPMGEGFKQPVAMMALPGDGRPLVVEKAGTIRFLEGGAPGAVFLDVSGLVSDGGEQGLLGLAFDPDFAASGAFYLNYTDREGDTQIVRYTARGGVADPASAAIVLSVAQPQRNHNGGWIAFGPDGLLYIGMGDGGGAGDEHGEIGNGQDKNALLGKILRIDPSGASDGKAYGIPADNPFATGGGAPEVFAYGMRNPWRNAFDGEMFYVADVGQYAWEEINVLPLAEARGANFGWRTMEGRACFPEGTMCVQGGMVMPVHVYGHDAGCSITGGAVYRGAALPALAGRYFFADWCSGVVEALRYENGEATGLVSTADGIGSVGNVNAFGTDAEGEMYVLNDDGTILKLVAAP
ncbi:MAG: glucose dehydrogenase [Hyphomicrobiales bacterium]|nr:MAG: glucose dehydrogenase [Hyphomicrobiales bacterium]